MMDEPLQIVIVVVPCPQNPSSNIDQPCNPVMLSTSILGTSVISYMIGELGISKK